MTKITRRLRSIALVGGLVALAPACSFLVDTSGLQGEAPDTGIGDGRTDGPTLVETDGPSEAAVEGGTDAPGGRLCADAGSAVVCEDFDDSTALNPAWTKEESNGALTIIADGLSRPNALEAKVNGPGSNAYLEKQIPFAKAVRCELDMKLLDAPTGSEIDYLVIHTDAQDHNLYFAHFDGKFALAEWKETGIDRTVDVKAPQIGTWIHVVLATDGAKLTLQVDADNYTLANIVDVSGPNRQLIFGMPYARGNAATRVLYDNILCTAGP